MRNAPHYVKPLEVVFPTKYWFAGLQDAIMGYFGFNARIKDRGAILIEIGLQIYDFYNRKVRALPDHRFLNKSVLRQDFPALRSLEGGLTMLTAAGVQPNPCTAPSNGACCAGRFGLPLEQ